MMTRIASLVATALIWGILSAPPALAQTTYQSWGDPDEPSVQNTSGAVTDERLQSLIKDLDAILTQAEKDKAGDPLFLRDLRNLVRSYTNPFPNLVLHEDFSDGDYTQNPVWTVGAGRYFMEKGWGIRNALDTTKTTNTGTGDPGVDLLVGILGKALGGNTATTPSSTKAIQPTSIFTDAVIANAFSIEMSASSWVKEGRLAIGPYQGTTRNAGYRLIYTIGGSIDLIAKFASGARTIDSNPGPFMLEDKKVHTFTWTRDKNGQMKVGLDGTTLFDVRDASFRDPFEGFGMATNGGDFIVKSVDIYTTP
jgi:hypothetical protein